MDYNSINPYIRRAWNSILIYPFHLSRRIILDYELIYIESGKMRFYYNGIDYICKSGDLLLIRPGIEHEFQCIDGDLSQPHIHFDIEYDSQSNLVPITFKKYSDLPKRERLMLRSDVFESYPQNPIIKITNKEKLLELFFEIIEYFNKKRNDLYIKAKMLEIINLIIDSNFKNFFIGETTKNNICQDIKNFLKSNIRFPITLESIEKQFNYNRCYLEREFKKLYGLSIIKYHQIKRIEYAEFLLDEMNVSQVCEFLNFGSIYSFSRAYKMYFGFSPSQTGKSGSTRTHNKENGIVP